MTIRILTDNNFFDVEPKGDLDKKILMQALNDMSTIAIETKQGSTVFINTANIVSIEVFDITDIPPIQKEE